MRHDMKYDFEEMYELLQMGQYHRDRRITDVFVMLSNDSFVFLIINITLAENIIYIL